MKKSLLAVTVAGAAVISACNGTGGGSSGGGISNNLPAAFQCLPSQLPIITSSSSSSIKLAYASNCLAESSSEATSLQQMAIALEGYSVANASYGNYCTGTPIKYTESGGVGTAFIVTAAHCVVGGTKAANAPVTTANITTFNDIQSSGHNAAWIAQFSPAASLESSNMTAQITAVYVPPQYCFESAFNANGTCTNLALQNGDVAVLKVSTLVGKQISVNPDVSLAPESYTLDSGLFLLTLGYGGTNPNGTPAEFNASNPDLYYINYRYYGTDSYLGIDAESAILNGYQYNNDYYSIICPGDSGGGDFAWTGSSWYLLGIHSYGPTYCGAFSSEYSNAFDASADERPFNSWIESITVNDTAATGCASLGSAYVCESGAGQ